MLLIQGLPCPLKPLPCAHFHATIMISFLLAGVLLASVKKSRPLGKTGRQDKLQQLPSSIHVQTLSLNFYALTQSNLNQDFLVRVFDFVLLNDC